MKRRFSRIPILAMGAMSALFTLFAPKAHVQPLVHSGPAPASVHDSLPLLGFSREHAVQEHALEAELDKQINRADLSTWLKRLSAHPHHLGSPYDKENAEFVAAEFRKMGLTVEIEQFKVLFPTPKERLLEMTEPIPFMASLTEPALKEDATSGIIADRLPTYNAYSCDGDVAGKLVYVGYGTPKDYETLEAKGIDVKGKIVIARYGGGVWRGIKPKVAAEHNAIGCIIYSDPRDDGYFQDDTYPNGPMRPGDGVQIGNVSDVSHHTGSPPTITKIPVLPISYNDALPLLHALGGPVAPEPWRGVLPFTYHMGPGPTTVHLKVSFNWNMVTAYDVIAKLPGSTRPDEWVIRGNHHDAWVCGADDPLAGTVALMEEARAVSQLTKTGWRPKRTLVYCVWDGEEEGLLGSTAWVEKHEALLRKHAVAYINSDGNERGYLSVGGSHILEKAISEVAEDVTDPETGKSVSARYHARQIVRGDKDARKQEGIRVEALGTGSDYTPFLEFLGIPCLNLGFSGESPTGVYHSAYDSYDWYIRFGDPNFDYGIALVQTAGRMDLRLADADLLPFEFTHLADTVNRYAQEVIQLTDTARTETEEWNQNLEDGTPLMTFDPKETNVLPKPKSQVPYLNFAPLQNAVARLRTSARSFASALHAPEAKDYSLSEEHLKAIDTLLMNTERAMLRSEGLPGRPFYRHQVYAPGLYTGYAVKTLPGVREAIEQRNWKEATEQIVVVSNT